MVRPAERGDHSRGVSAPPLFLDSRSRQDLQPRERKESSFVRASRLRLLVPKDRDTHSSPSNGTGMALHRVRTAWTSSGGRIWAIRSTGAPPSVRGSQEL